MTKHIIEILSYVMKEIRENSFDEIDMQFIIDVLAEQGFSDEDISSAMYWIMNHGENVDRLIQGSSDGVPKPVWRLLNERESDAISPSAFGYLFHLRELELLNDDAMEKIIERATTLQLSQLDVEEMQDLIAAVVLDFERSASDGYFQFTATRLPH